MDHQDFNLIAHLETLAPDQEEETEPQGQEDASADIVEWDELMELLFKDEEQLPTNGEGISGASLDVAIQPQSPDFNRKRKGKEVEKEDCQITENVVHKETCTENKHGGASTLSKEQIYVVMEDGGSISKKQKREAHNLRERQRRKNFNKLLKELQELIEFHDEVSKAELLAEINKHIILLQAAKEMLSLILSTVIMILDYYYTVNVVGSEDENQEMSIVADIFLELIEIFEPQEEPSEASPLINIPDEAN